MLMSKTYYVTFSPRYRNNEHPVLGKVDPTGWGEVVAGSYQEATKIVTNSIGPYFDQILSESHFDKQGFKAGKQFDIG